MRPRCPACGAESGPPCPHCRGEWEVWELAFPALPQEHQQEQVADWLGQLPQPACIEIAAGPAGLKLRLFAPQGKAHGAIAGWAALSRQQSRWLPAGKVTSEQIPAGRQQFLRAASLLPELPAGGGDRFLALGARLLGQQRGAQEVGLRIWILDHAPALQERLKGLAAYAYGSEGGVGAGSPNPWALRLGLWRAVLAAGGGLAACCGGALAAAWLPPSAGLLGMLAGSGLFLTACLGRLEWLRWRSLPQQTVAGALEGDLLRVAFSLSAPQPQEIRLLAGESAWMAPGRLGADWPQASAHAMPLPAGRLAALITPPALGESSGLLDRAARQDVPAPPPSRPLVSAALKIGTAVATGERIGIDPDGHGLAVGGSRSGKSSFTFSLLEQLIEQGPDAPGLLLVDPHLSLADAFLARIDALPPEARAAAVGRLRIISPDQPEVVPLNLLALPEFVWAGNAIVQAGQRIWGDYWGPRMQAALLGLFRLAHAWNRRHPERPLGLLHVVFAAFNTEWRHSTLAYLPPVERIGALALDALLGQLEESYKNRNQGWVTEVVSPILSKAMALELSPWLFAAMHQARFADLERWVRERCWVILRLPGSDVGQEGARLLAGIFYSVFESAFRRATLRSPVPTYFVIDETQEIAGGMRLEALLSEGAKFGARLFVLTQSLTMLRRTEGFEGLVQALLANTSTQAFFSPDPEDAELIRSILSSDLRYGDHTPDLPSLQCWLRARLGGAWQPPALARIEPLPGGADPAHIQALIREVIAAHPGDYAPADGWQAQVVAALEGIVPPAVRGWLDPLLPPEPGAGDPGPAADRWRLGL